MPCHLVTSILLLSLLATSTTAASCPNESRLIRKDWDLLSSTEKTNYVQAIHCLVDLPSDLSPYAYPTATNRYFDFASIYMDKYKDFTMTGFSWTWRRYFLWLFESHLRDHCGYQGCIPYWNFGIVEDLTANSILDGTLTSLSGNGIWDGSNETLVLSPSLSIPGGSGGGCVQSGPFANFSTTMLAVPNTYLLNGTDLPLWIYEYNPNCLTRDFNQYAYQTYLNATLVTSAAHSQSVSEMDSYYEGVVGSMSLGFRSAIGFAISGTATSITPQDPMFWPAFAMFDRIYASWQALHPEQASDMYGTKTSQNLPPSRNVTLNSIMPGWGYLETNTLKTRDLVSTTEGRLCYEYDSLIV